MATLNEKTVLKQEKKEKDKDKTPSKIEEAFEALTLDSIIAEEPETKEEDEFAESKIYFERWEEIDLKHDLIAGIYSVGFDVPSFIQKTSVVPIIKGCDIRAQAQSGTGKTGAFTIGVLQRVEQTGDCEAIILSPTRELAAQNQNVMEMLGQHMKINSVLLIGGGDVHGPRNKCKSGATVVVGTPGRVYHMINEKSLNVKNVKILVIDEADEMLALGFQEQVKAIFETLPENIQVAMFSATWGEEEIEVSKQMLRDNQVKIDLRKKDQTLSGLRQYFVNLGTKPNNKESEECKKVCVLIDILNKNSGEQSIVFVNNTKRVDLVHSICLENKIVAVSSHSELGQEAREYALNQFKKGDARVLISSNLLGRGVDVQQLSLVINYDLPEKNETYIHRIGRAGRYGRRGIAVNLIWESEMDALNKIKEFYCTDITEMPATFK